MGRTRETTDATSTTDDGTLGLRTNEYTRRNGRYFRASQYVRAGAGVKTQRASRGPKLLRFKNLKEGYTGEWIDGDAGRWGRWGRWGR